MVSVLYSNSRSIPLLVCEQCRGTIRDAGLAMVVYGDPPKDGAHQTFAFLHKGVCDRSYKGARDRIEGGWAEMSDFLVRLCANAGMNTAGFVRALERAKALESF